MRWGGGVALVVLALVSACGRSPRAPRPAPPAIGGVQVGVASWYGPGFHGKRTANGEVYDQYEMTAAHPSLPHGTRAMVTNMTNGRSVEVRINDRGPFVGGRVIDLSYAAARAIDMVGPGTARVRIETFGPASAPPPPPPRIVPAVARDLPDGTYLVEIASLTDPAKADHLRMVLSRRFPDAFVSRMPGTIGGYHRVRIGPYPLRTVAQERAEAVSRLGYPAIIVEEAAP
jgi:rare lipoprotein A